MKSTRAQVSQVFSTFEELNLSNGLMFKHLAFSLYSRVTFHGETLLLQGGGVWNFVRNGNSSTG